MRQTFYKCSLCGNMVAKVVDRETPLVCCGKEMEIVVPNTVDASLEKHVPAVDYQDNVLKVQVGSVEHPMTAEHHIVFIYVATKNGGQRKALTVDAEPTATFSFVDDQPEAVYAYCNLHGLWVFEF